MNRKHATAETALSMLFAAALLAACGGGGGSGDGNSADSAQPETVPADATASPEAFTQYLAARTDDEQREPIVVSELVPPTSETAEPLPVVR